MKLRQDAAAAAAEAIVWIERYCGGAGSEESPAAPVKDDSLVCTTGSMALWPGASNVIAGAANFSVDIRWALCSVCPPLLCTAWILLFRIRSWPAVLQQKLVPL